MRWILWSLLLVVGATLGGAAAADAVQLVRGERALRRAGERPPAFPDLDLFPTVAVRCGRPRFRSRRSRVARGAAWSLAVLLLLLGSATVYVLRELARIDRFDLALSHVEPGEAMNILLVGTDSRAGTEVAPGEEVSGQRADTILILRLGTDGTAGLLSIPRDLWVQPPNRDNAMKINATYADGRQLLVDTLRDTLGIPVHHYIEVNFAGFQRLVDEVEGVDVLVASPLRDEWSGVFLPTPGCQHLDGSAALAFVRSRHLEVFTNGEWQPVPGADRGRMERQRWFVLNLATALRGLDLADPLRLTRLLKVAGDDIGIDKALSFSALRQLASVARTIDPSTVGSATVPAEGFLAPDGSDALQLLADETALVLGPFIATQMTPAAPTTVSTPAALSSTTTLATTTVTTQPAVPGTTIEGRGDAAAPAANVGDLVGSCVR